VSFLSPGGIRGLAGRLAYSELSGLFTMVQGEAESVSVPPRLAEEICRASDYSWPHTFVVFDHLQASLVKMGMPANHFHMVTGLNRRRWQYFSDYACILNYRWENLPDYAEDLDRPIPMLYRLNGGETQAKLLQARRV